MSKACKKLHEELSNRRKFCPSYKRGKLKKELDDNAVNNGIYIVFDKNEKTHGAKGRIVYVGINKKSGRLIERVCNHFSRQSADHLLRKKIGECFSSTGNKKKQKVSDYIEENLSFAVIEVKDTKKRKNLEKRIISTIAACNECTPSLPRASWLGLHRPGIGLWNDEGLKEKPLSEKEVDNFLKKHKK